jgi:hypothetical protein
MYIDTPTLEAAAPTMNDLLLCGSKIRLHLSIPVFLEWSFISASIGLHAGFLNTLFPSDSPT